MIEHSLAQHIYKIEKFQDRGLAIYLSFRGKVTIQIIGIYEYANKTERRKCGKALTSWINEQITNAQKKHHIPLVMGDFNGVVNPKIDRVNSNLKKTETKILETLQYKGFQDCYRLINGRERKFTFYKQDLDHNRRPASRIDQIWILMDHANNLINAKIVDTEFSAFSDHNAMTININNRKYTNNKQYNKNRRHRRIKRL
ncbi:hypothetical protein Glove_7g20 [Diversispora epigaea]|uniref:Endonuclease/exonuclease/phosphatase domain-containing protein n=1 Tax=Diversispora epigaea TaxID=1348612 RepID=A0A397JQD1_9GLOM|nr:hypothetical protein Glove_7g20 [Diversispora epigaea]